MTTFALTAHDWDQAKGPCCGVLACAIAAQKPFKDAWAWLKSHGDRCWRNTWKGSTYTHDYPKWLNHAGVKFRHVLPGKMTLSGFVHYKAKPNIPYLVVTTGHAQIVYNGKVVDQRGVFDIQKCWGRLKFIKEVFIIKIPNKTWQEFGLPLFDNINN